VDVTWWTRPSANGAARAPVPLRAPVRDVVLGLYSMLRRHVDAKAPENSVGDLVVRPGVGIPVLLGRPLSVESTATRRAVVPILDTEAYDRALDELHAAIATLRQQATDNDRLYVVPVTLDSRWNDRLGDGPRVRVGKLPEAARARGAARGVAASLAGWLMASPERQVSIYVYSGEEEDETDDAEAAKAATALEAHLRKTTTLERFTARRLVKPVREKLAAASGDAVLLSQRTDRYERSARSHDAVLAAKTLQIPVISVWSAELEEQRALTYGGNMPTLQWGEQRLDDIVDRCLQAWLHHLHFRLAAPAALDLAGIKCSARFLSRPPELVDFALGGLPVDLDAVVMYPDPPLPSVETRVLRLAHPRAQLATPTTMFGGALCSSDPAPMLAGRNIALSLGDSPDASNTDVASNSDGFNALHVEDAVAQITLCIARAGARICYGGHRFERGFTRFLNSIIKTHNTIGAGEVEIPRLFLAAHLAKPDTDLELAVQVIGEDIVTDLPGVAGQVGKALQLREMRKTMAEKCHARIALGGKSAGYSGRFPGVVEECWRMLVVRKPIYVIGGFGGGAELVARALRGETPGALREAEMRAPDSDYDKLCNAYDQDSPRDTDPRTLDELAAAIASFGETLRGEESGAQWHNGLTVAENLRLFQTRDVTEISHLVMKGLAIALPRRASGGVAAEGAVVRLFRGSIADIEAVDSYAIPVIRGLAPTGAAAAMDRRLAGRIRDQLLQPIAGVTALERGGARLAGRTVLLVPLGSEDDIFRNRGDAVKQACRDLARYVRANGIASLAVVPFGGNVGVGTVAAVRDLLDALKAELRQSPITLTICEVVPDRYAALKAGIEQQFVELAASPVLANAQDSGTNRVSIVVHRKANEIGVTVVPPAEATSAVVHHVSRALSAEQQLLFDHLAHRRVAPASAELTKYGIQLATALFSDKQLDTLAAFREHPLDVLHDVEAATIPWEMLVVERAEKLVAPAAEGGIRRRLMVESSKSSPPPRRLEIGDKLRVLLVVNPRDLIGADLEVKTLTAAMRGQPDRIDVLILENEDVRTVANSLSQHWDVLHYAGHAKFSPNQKESGLYLRDGLLTSASISDEIKIPSLVVLNACESARMRGMEETPLSPAEAATSARGLAQQILVAGARAFLGTFWEVRDAAAAKFATMLYPRLLAGDTVGASVLAARRALKDNKPQDSDWTNYNLYGDTELRW
jgi:CHAT domain-containing protein